MIGFKIRLLILKDIVGLYMATVPLQSQWLQNLLFEKLTLSILQFFLVSLASLELASISHRGQPIGVWREYFGESPARPRDLDETLTLLPLSTDRLLLPPVLSRRHVDLSYMIISADRTAQCTSAVALV